jgi:hypothetical protein
MTGRRLGQNLTRHSLDPRGQLAGVGEVSATQDSRRCGESRPLRLPQRRLADSTDQSGQPRRKVIRDNHPISLPPRGMPLVQ